MAHKGRGRKRKMSSKENLTSGPNKTVWRIQLHGISTAGSFLHSITKTEEASMISPSSYHPPFSCHGCASISTTPSEMQSMIWCTRVDAMSRADAVFCHS